MAFSTKLMSDYNNFNKGNKMKEVIDRNVNFEITRMKLIVLSEWYLRGSIEPDLETYCCGCNTIYSYFGLFDFKQINTGAVISTPFAETGRYGVDPQLDFNTISTVGMPLSIKSKTHSRIIEKLHSGK